MHRTALLYVDALGYRGSAVRRRAVRRRRLAQAFLLGNQYQAKNHHHGGELEKMGKHGCLHEKGRVEGEVPDSPSAKARFVIGLGIGVQSELVGW